MPLDMALEKDYEVLERLGEGAFGKVYKARHRRSEDLCAVKQIKLGARSWDEALRSTELQALKALRHAYIVRLRELIRSTLDGSLYYIFEFIGSDLFELVRQNPRGLDEARAVELTRQLFAGVAHIHQHNYFHRDIKPENILFDVAQGTIRLADFGEARSLRARPPFTDYVGTRWYRAPECLLRDRSYSSPVDIWASGLVFAELLRGSAVFCGTSTIDQLYKIFQVLGTPLLVDWPDFARLSEACRFRAPEGRGCGLQRVLPNTSKQAQACLTEVLTLNPRRRPQARRVLEGPLFGGQCPGLELDRLDTSRSAASEERLDTTRSSAAGTLVSAQAPEELGAAVSVGGTPPPPRTPPSPRSPKPPIKKADDLDVDLDAELDKILGQPPVPVSATSSAATPPPQPPPALPLEAETSGAGADGAHVLNGRHKAAAKAVHARPKLHEKEQSPCKEVDALLDSLCVDLGVGGADVAGPLKRLQAAEARRLRTAHHFPGPPRAVADDVAVGEAARSLPVRIPADQASDASIDGPCFLPPTPSRISMPKVEPLDDCSRMAARAATPGSRLAMLRLEAPGDCGGLSRATTPGSRKGMPRLEQPEDMRAVSRATTPGSRLVLPRVDDDRETEPDDTLSDVGVGSAAEVVSSTSELRRTTSQSTQWSAEETSELRCAVQRVRRRGVRDMELLWQEVSRELGGFRGPRACRSQYARDRRASGGADSGTPCAQEGA